MAGCSRGENEATGDGTLEALDREALSTTTTIDPWAVPDPIDAAYVQRVITEIAEVEGRVRRDVWGMQRFDEQSKARLAAIYEEPFLSVITHSFSEGSMKDHPEYKPNPQSTIVDVTELVTARADCIFVLVRTDDNRNRLTTVPPRNYDVTLRRGATTSINPTGWKEVDWRSIDGYEPVNQCDQ